MPFTLFEWSTKDERDETSGSTVVTGTVTNNADYLNQGKVLVRIPSLDLEVWARLVAPGAGPNAGLFYVPRQDDEVLIALAQESPDDAFLLGGLWNTKDTPPVDDPLLAPSQRIFRTGLDRDSGHSVEFDDSKRSITITTSTDQKITLDPTTIELANSDGNLKVTLDSSSQTVTIKGVNVTVEADGSLSLKGKTVSLEASPGTMTVEADAVCSIKGLRVEINS